MLYAGVTFSSPFPQPFAFFFGGFGLKCNRNGLTGYVHYKFLSGADLKPNSNGYVKVLDVRNIGGSSDVRELDRVRFVNPIADVQKLKNAAKCVAKQEKSGIHKIIHSHHNIGRVLDVEIRFRGYGKKQPDLAALCAAGEGYRSQIL